MILDKSIQMMSRSFEKTRYSFTELPGKISGKSFGIYVNVPFCRTKCGFCPFYKELFNEQVKNAYLDAITQEIVHAKISGSPNWIYFGGGTPNLLSIKELHRIIKSLQDKVTIKNMGIELLPALVTDEYLGDLKNIGFTKISFGVESLSNRINNASGRVSVSNKKIRSMIELALGMNLWVNTDLIVGLKEQDGDSFMEDIRMLANFQPNQITTYPYMSIRGLKDRSLLPDKEKYKIIEEAGEYLLLKGYKRNSIWCFTRGNNIYDSSQDELIDDYIGFGPAAFSTFDRYKVVNPDVKTYLQNYKNGNEYGFLSIKSASADNWRKFARMIYTLKCHTSRSLPWYINTFCLAILSDGIRKNGSLTEKGLIFAHDITKTVVESLPFPLQNKACISNYDDYVEYKTAID